MRRVIGMSNSNAPTLRAIRVWQSVAMKMFIDRRVGSAHHNLRRVGRVRARWAKPTLRLIGAVVALGLAILVATPANADQYAKYNNTGNQLAHEGRYSDALNHYETARIERPGTPEIDYNIGNVFHAMGEFDTALVAYQEALSGVAEPLVPSTYYNMGNTLYRKSDFPSALEAYKRALLANPNDRDAKFNLELALREMEADSSQQQQPDDENQQDSTEQEQEQQEQQSDQESDSTQQQQDEQQQDEEQQNENSSDPNDQQPQEPSDQQAQAPPPQGMTREDAERLLDALKQDELDLQKQRAQRMANPAPVLRDW
jgi:tetratricopeptide (TPR) repeat protein